MWIIVFKKSGVHVYTKINYTPKQQIREIFCKFARIRIMLLQSKNVMVTKFGDDIKGITTKKMSLLWWVTLLLSSLEYISSATETTPTTSSPTTSATPHSSCTAERESTEREEERGRSESEKEREEGKAGERKTEHRIR